MAGPTKTEADNFFKHFFEDMNKPRVPVDAMAHFLQDVSDGLVATDLETFRQLIGKTFPTMIAIDGDGQFWLTHAGEQWLREHDERKKGTTNGD